MQLSESIDRLTAAAMPAYLKILVSLGSSLSGSFYRGTHEGEEWGKLGRQVTVCHDEGGVGSENGGCKEEMRARRGETEDSASSLAEVIYCQVRFSLGESVAGGSLGPP
jgi:hypothetical protein